MQDIEAGEIGDLLDTAESMKEIATREIKKVPTLRGKTVVNLFYESSTRTRTSFEIAGKWLSADVINFSASGLERGEGRELPRHRPEHRGHEPGRGGGAPQGGGRPRPPRQAPQVLGESMRATAPTSTPRRPSSTS
jgi:hypothetical protein